MGIRESVVFRPLGTEKKPIEKLGVARVDDQGNIIKQAVEDVEGQIHEESTEVVAGLSDEERRKNNEKMRQTARGFIFKSKDLGAIRAQAAGGGLNALKKLELINCELIKKNADSKNPNQWMPPGGKIETDRGENASEASMRESYEELGARSPSGHIFQGKYLYSLPFGAGLNRSYIFGGRIMPSDEPYPIDNKEDKVEEVTPFGHRELIQLLTQGRFADQKKKGELLDSMQIESHTDDRNLHGFALDENRTRDVFKINMGVMDFSAGQEARKKLEVMKLFLTKMKVIFLRNGNEICAGTNPIDGQEMTTNLGEWKKIWSSYFSWLSGESSVLEEKYEPKNNTEFLGKVERAWEDMFTVLESAKSEAIKKRIVVLFERAVDLGNFKEEIAGEYSAGSKIEAVLHFLYTLSASEFFDNSYLKIAKKNEKLKDFVGRLEEFFAGIPNPPGETSEETQAGILRKMKYIGRMRSNRDYLDRISHHFAKVFEIPSRGEEFGARRDHVNDFLDYIAKTAEKLDDSGAGTGESMLNELRGANLSDLVYLAFSPDDAPGKKNGGNDANPGEYTLDARRHLFVMYLMNDAEQFISDQDALLKDPKGQTEDKIEMEIFGKMLSSPSGRVYFRKVYQDTEKKDKITGEKIKKRVLTNIEQVSEIVAGTFARTIRHMTQTSAGSEYKLEVDTTNRIKQRSSIYRKVVERGMDEMYEEDGTPVITDRLRRTIMIHQCPVDKIRRVDFAGDEYVYAGLINSDKKIGADNQNEIEAVLEVMKGIIDVGKVRGRNTVRIIKYKPTPQLGERMQSSTVGAAGDVRLAKFVIEYTELDKKGKPVVKNAKIVKRYEEVQIFSPSTDGRTAAFWREDKKIKDVNYGRDRLYNTMKKALRSPVVLLLGKKKARMDAYLVKHAEARKLGNI